ncbi:MAG: hypothetical protein KDD44_10775, partial [Bdellovibrionales bacterium]|nr:hypothetical protein [Bdellovibrionales bacterium]
CPQSQPSWWDRSLEFEKLPPSCPACGGLLRPGVVWFGESIDPSVLRAAAAATECDVFLSVGTSALVYPAAGLVHEARLEGAFTVEINREATSATQVVDCAVQGSADEVLSELQQLL